MNNRLTIFFVRVVIALVSFVRNLTLQSSIVALFWTLTFLQTTNLLPQFLIFALIRWGIIATLFNLQALYSCPTHVSPATHERLVWMNFGVLVSSLLVLFNDNNADMVAVFSAPPSYWFYNYSPYDAVLDLVHGWRFGASGYYEHLELTWRTATFCWESQYQNISSLFKNAEFWRPWIMYQWMVAFLVNKYTFIKLYRKFY